MPKNLAKKPGHAVRDGRAQFVLHVQALHLERDAVRATRGDLLQALRAPNRRQYVQPISEGGEIVVRGGGECCGFCGGRCARCFPDTRLTLLFWLGGCSILVLITVIILAVVLNNRLDEASDGTGRMLGEVENIYNRILGIRLLFNFTDIERLVADTDASNLPVIPQAWQDQLQNLTITSARMAAAGTFHR